MGMLGNQSRLNFGTGYVIGGLYSKTPSAIQNNGEWIRFNAKDGAQSVLNLAANPTGYSGSSAYNQPQTGGEISSNYQMDFSVNGGSLNLAAGINITGESSIVFTVDDASLQLIVSATGDASFTLTCSASLAGALSAIGSASFAIDTNTPILGALINAIASASFSMTASGEMIATGNLSGDITPFTELSPESLSAAVWNSIAASFVEAGTMGALLNAAGSGGMDPALVQKIEELWTLAGLDISSPLVVSETSRTVGTIEQSIADAAGEVTVTRL